jgi:hypothetical protein
MQWPTLPNADSSRTRINRHIAEPLTVQVKVSVDSSETVISRQDAELRPVAAAANAVLSRTRRAKQRVVPVSEVALAGQQVQIPVNAASSRTRMAVPTAAQSTVTVAASAALSRTVTFRPCVEPKPGVVQASVDSLRVVTCRRRVEQRWATDSKRHFACTHTTVRFPALQFNAVKKQFMVTRKVPIADHGFPEMPARYPSLGVTFDIPGTMDQLTAWHSTELPAG